MTTIHLITEINATIEKCFDVSRDIDMHKLSAKNTNEQAIAGRTTGLCELGDKITWKAKHFGITQQLTVEITKLDKPFFFEDKMLKGAFKSMKHEHHFEAQNGKTIMTDKFQYEVPFGILGKLFDRLVLKNYMTRFLLTRNEILKSIVEKNKSHE
jgi:ligand-binding SRPBCC domain-containing protein